MEDHETLETSAVVCKLSDAVKAKINNLLADGVVTSGIVVGSIFLTRDELFWVVKLSVSTSSDLINHTRLQIKVHGSWDVLSSTSLREEGVERIITTTNSLI